LVDTRNQRREVKAVIGDLEHTVRATFTKTALDRDAITTSGVPFEKLQVGAIFKILACEIRFSDCFDPARVDIRITSVAVIHPGIGSGQFAKSLKRLEEEPSVVLMLKEYTLRRSDQMDSDEGNDDSMASQDEFMTQLQYQSLKAPSPIKSSLVRPPSPSKLLEKERNYGTSHVGRAATNVSSKESCEAPPQQCRSTATQGTSPSSAQFVTQMPVHGEERTKADENNSANTFKAIKPEHTRRPSTELNGKSLTLEKGRTETSSCEGTSVRSSNGGHLPWKKRAAGARYLPRYVGVRARDQQELIENVASWQPSLVGQRIEGQVPLQLLEKLSRAADAAAEDKAREIHDAESDDNRDLDLPDRDTPTIFAIDSRPVDSALQQSPYVSSSETSWEETPPRPPQVRSLLPPDSSPLKVTEKAGANEVDLSRRSNVDESCGPTAHAEHEIPSSPFHTTAFSDDEERATSPARHGVTVPVARQATFLSISSGSDDHSNDVTPSAGLLEADVRRMEEPTFVAGAHLKKSSDDPAVRAATSSLDATQSVQISRTHAIHRRKSDAMNMHANRRMEKTSDQNHLSFPHINQVQSHPPSSQFVLATYLAQSPQAEIATSKSVASQAMPASERRSSGLVFEQESDQPQFEQLRSKRPRESSASETSYKRQKTEFPRGKNAPTAKDPDLWPTEIRVRQDRSDFMAEETRKKAKEAREREDRRGDERVMGERRRREKQVQEEKKLEEVRQEKERLSKTRQERSARDQQAYEATLLNDVHSVESRDRPLSPRSSVPSVSKHRASTPITGASDYQMSVAGKDHVDRRQTRGLSIAQRVAQDTFELFRSTYPDYKGGRTQFEQACQLLQDLGKSAPRAYLNDDFVYRYNNDYMGDYLLLATRERMLPMPFERFYQELEQNPSYEPRSVAKVLKPARMASMLNASPLREGTVSIQEHSIGEPQLFWPVSLSAASNIEGRAVPLPARTEQIAFIKSGSQKPNSQSQSQKIKHSQDSSITDWLKRSGEGSPELGSPPILDKLADVPELDLEIITSNPAPARNRTPRPVPWRKQNKLPPPSTAPATSASASAPKLRDVKGKGNAVASRRHTDSPIPTSIRRAEAKPIDFSTPFVRPRSNAEMAFDKLAEQFLMQDERRGVPRAPGEKLNSVDIFSW
jgi:hypothetical protein